MSKKKLLFKIILRDWIYMREQGWLSEKGLKELEEVEGYDNEEANGDKGEGGGK